MTKYLNLDLKNSKHMKFLSKYLRNSDPEYRDEFKRTFPNIYRKLKKLGVI